ncbi:glycerophosphodiester phosphodiesterase family protein [Modicisalibacter radicis]|uniref:glycerophosphodiester phosphodiesterase family protein n=1 Tax=Halomonas sp. EAR18 TaxID=2518972 RepID=UPI00109D1EBD|nr:glycerophosphodiester phosphodiesterase family protein [Halomonas sp. EAR18]
MTASLPDTPVSHLDASRGAVHAAPPALIAHRGLSAHAPENTLAAVQAAHDAGCRWVELDVQLLGDGTPVIWHDSGLKRCTGVGGRLNRLDLAAARRLDAGRWFSPAFVGEGMATLEEMLALIGRLGLGLNLELKVGHGRDAEALVAAALPPTLARLPAERLIVSSFDSRALRAARHVQPDARCLRLGLLYDRVPRNWARQAQALDAYSLHVDWRRLKPTVARAIAASPYWLLCYTINDREVYRRLRDWGVHGAISDDPLQLDLGQAERVGSD